MRSDCDNPAFQCAVVRVFDVVCSTECITFFVVQRVFLFSSFSFSSIFLSRFFLSLSHNRFVCMEFSGVSKRNANA